MKYMMAKVLYGAVGILLAAACICTGEKSYLRRTGRFMRRHALLNRRWKRLDFPVFLSGTTASVITTGTVTM